MAKALVRVVLPRLELAPVEHEMSFQAVTS